MASFNTSSLKLTHINIRSCRNKEMEISIFLKENDIDILTLNETWLKSTFKLDISNYSITHNDRPREKTEVLQSLYVITSVSVLMTCAPLSTLTTNHHNYSKGFIDFKKHFNYLYSSGLSYKY